MVDCKQKCENENISNKEKVLEYVRADNKRHTAEILEFCDKNGIDFVYFNSIDELFDYYDEDEYQSFTSRIVDIICKDGVLIKILG